MDLANRDQIEATREELDEYIALSHRAAERTTVVGAEDVPWVVVEELIAKHQPLAGPERTHWAPILHAAMALAALASVTIPLVRMTGLLTDEDPGKVHKV